MNLRLAGAIIVSLAAMTGCTSNTPATATTSTVTSTVTTMVTATPSATDRGTAQVAAEACGNIVIGSDGDFGPALCLDGHPNVQEVDRWRDLGYVTIDLDPAATSEQVHKSLCLDLNVGHATPLMLQTLYKTAAALNHWAFPVSPLPDAGSLDC